MELMTPMAGFCTVHNIDKMFVGLQDATEPTCVRCVAAATPKLGRTQTVEDPGEDFFQGKGSNAKITVLEPTHGVASLPITATPVKGNSLESHIQSALSWLTNAPMPKDLKQFKSLQKAITILEGLVEKTNG